MMAVRVTGRRSVVIARSLHPEYREVLATYAHHQNLPLSTCSSTAAAAWTCKSWKNPLPRIQHAY